MAAGSLSAVRAAQPPAEEVAPAVTAPVPAAEPADRPLTIALLMPPDESPFLSAAKIVGNGLIAANRRSDRPAEILLIEAQPGTTTMEQLRAAALSGADAAIGPIERDAVLELAQANSLPLPTVALNATAASGVNPPPELIELTLSTEQEAEWIARLAAASLPSPEPSPDGAAPAAGPARVAILAGQTPREERLRHAYEHALTQAGVAYDVISVTPDTYADVQARFEPSLSDEDTAALRERERKLLAAATSDEAKKRIARTVASERRAMIVSAEPPYKAALLALSAQQTSLVRSRLPLRTRVWGTSETNPGDPQTSSTAATLAYDLNRVVLADCPLLVRYDAASFEARFDTEMPYSPSAKRLFALGADALEIASRWSRLEPVITLAGETGSLRLDRAAGAQVERAPQTILIRDGALVAIEPASAASDSPVVIEPATAGPLADEAAAQPTDAALSAEPAIPSVVAADPGEGPAPTPMLPAIGGGALPH